MRPSVLFIFAKTPDTPLFTQFYEYVSRSYSPLDARVYSRNVSMPIPNMVAAKFGGVPPNFIFSGFPLGSAIRRSADYIKEKGIKIILELGDTHNFVWDNPKSPYLELRIGDVEVDYLIARWRKTEGYDEEEEPLRRFMEKKKQLRRAEIIHVPWGINPEIYRGAPVKRDIDVSLLGRYYSKRNVAREAMFRLREKGFKVVLSKFPIPTLETYGDIYINYLRRSKIFLVLGGHRGRQMFLTQKFLEGAACGAMLLGDIPYTGKDVFEDGISIVEVTDEHGMPQKGYSSVDRQAQYYLEHNEERKRIALEGRRRVLETFSLDKVTKEFEDVLKKG